MGQKKLPKEVEAWMKGGENLFRTLIALVAAVRALAAKLKKTDAEWTAALHRLSQPEGKETLIRIAEVVLGVATTATAAVCHSFAGLFVTYDQSIGLRALIELTVGEQNFGNISSNITPERFKLAGTGVRNVKCRVEPCLAGESYEQAVARLKSQMPGFGNTGDLAGFLHDHPDEVEKWSWVAAVSEDSQWTDSGGDVYVPCADVDGADRYFGLGGFRCPRYSFYGVLVLCE